MLKFLIMGDFHEREKAPSSRKDDWQKTLDAKAKEILSIAKKEKVNAIIEAGDFLDSPKMGEKYLSIILDRWAGAKDANVEGLKHVNMPYPIIGVTGNHELFGNSYKNFDATSLNLLDQIGFINLVDINGPITFKDGDKTVKITGTGYHNDIDKGDRSGYIVEDKTADYHIHIVHGMAVDRADNGIFASTNIADIATKTNADLTITGHDHVGYGLRQFDDKYFLNPGAPVRITASKAEIEREVCVYILKLDKNMKPTFKKVVLQSALPAEDVIDRGHIDLAKDRKEFSEKVKASVDASKNYSVTNITDIVKTIADADNVKNDIRDDILDRFSQKMVNQVVMKQGQSYKIKKLVLENFQSHEHSEFVFDDEVNILTGSSGSGKTSVLRAFSWIFENKVKDSRRLITFGKPYASATILLDNGYTIERRVELKKSGFNGYIVTYPDGTVEKLNSNALEKVQEILGFTYLPIENSKDAKNINLNFLKQGEGWFFIGPETTSPDRAKIVGSVFKTQVADSVHKDIELEMRTADAKVQQTSKLKGDIDLQVEGMKYVPQMEKDIQKMEDLIQKIDIVNDRIDKIVAIEEQLIMIEKMMDKFKTIIKDLEDVDDIRSKSSAIGIQIKDKNEVFEKVTKAEDQMEQSGKSIKTLETIIKDIPDVDTAVLNHQTVEKIKTYNDIQKAESRAKTAKKAFMAVNKIYNDLKEINGDTVDKIKKDVKVYDQINAREAFIKEISLKIKLAIKQASVDTDDMIEKCKKLTEVLKKYADVTKTMSDLVGIKKLANEQKTEAEKAEKELSALKEEHINTVLALGYCPTCKQALDHASAANIAQGRLGQ